MKRKIVGAKNFVAKKIIWSSEILQMPFRENGFEPLYPLIKSKKLIGFLVAFTTMNRALAINSGIDASSGLGYVQWVIMAIGLIFTLIMGISTGFAFKNDAANAKAQLIGTILIPVLSAIVLYIYDKTLGVSLDATDGL